MACFARLFTRFFPALTRSPGISISGFTNFLGGDKNKEGGCQFLGLSTAEKN
jgi:hypothetical protein